MATENNDNVKLSATTVNGTDGREAHPKYWVAALVQVRSEKSVGKKLQELGIENYVPTQWEIHQWSDRKKKVEHVVIPVVVFIRVEKAQVEMLDRVFQTGDHVRIVRGPLQGLEGELCRIESEKPMVAIQIECLGYACVNIDKSDLELIDASI